MDSDRDDDSLGALSEGKIIRDIFLKRIPGDPPLEVGPGDDAAVLGSLHGKIVVTTDMLVQDVHFDLAYVPPYNLGEKAVLVNLSDIAAMGARPVAAFIAVGMPRTTKVAFARAFAKGVRSALVNYGIALGGGDTVRADKVVISVTLLGSIKGAPVRRSGARPGDQIYLSGVPGLSHLGLSILKEGRVHKEGVTRAGKRAVRRHLSPQVDIELGCFLKEKSIASAMIDTSDGIYTDLGHILGESGAGAEIDIPEAGIPSDVRSLAERFECTFEEAALFGGEDYHLLFTVRKGKVKQLLRWPGASGLHRIGTVVDKRGIFVNRAGRYVRLRGGGKPRFNHFKGEEKRSH